MGKSSTRRFKSSRHYPLSAKRKSPEVSLDLGFMARSENIYLVIQKLQGPIPANRTTAAYTISSMVRNSRCRKLLLRAHIASIVLAETLTDKTLENRAVGWEILRVLVREEGPGFCVHLYRMDVLTATSFAAKLVFKTLASESPEFTSTTELQLELTWKIAAALFLILEAVVDANSDAREKITQDGNVTDLLFLFALNKDVRSEIRREAREKALSLLRTLSEDNKPLAEIIASNADPYPLDGLSYLVNSGHPDLALASGILHNLVASLKSLDHDPKALGMTDKDVVGPLAFILQNGGHHFLLKSRSPGSPRPNLECLEFVLEIFASIGMRLKDALVGARARGEANGEQTGMQNDEMDVERQDDGGDDTGEGEGSEDDDETTWEQIDADIDMDMGGDRDGGGDHSKANGYRNPRDEIPTFEVLVESAIPALILYCDPHPPSRASDAPGASDVSEIPDTPWIPDASEIPDTPWIPDASEIPDAIRGGAVTALNNITWSVSCLDFSDVSNAPIAMTWLPVAYDIWNQVVVPILHRDTADAELISSATSLAWAVARTTQGPGKACIQLHMKRDEQRKFMSLFRTTQGLVPVPDDPFQGLGVKCIGVLGQMAVHPAPTALNREIGNFLVSVISSFGKTPATGLAEVVEAVNQVMDIYSDEEYPYDGEVFWAGDFVKHLEDALPKLKAGAKKVDGRIRRELRQQVDVSILNLGRFVKYKHKHRPASA